MIKGRFYLDSHGYPRAEYLTPIEVLGWYLEQDVQSDPVTCDELLRVCEEIVSGKISYWQGTGNAHTVTIADDCVIIESEFSDTAQTCKIPISDFATSVLTWKELIRTVPGE